ncbi:MAG: type II toxin-antitoxin system prevent-host-death family antitoxin [Planctomycetota bacterium]|nr:type II toxin-antitoxin system prevent-host-death family antitoxin [Planctomycetota bacterium]
MQTVNIHEAKTQFSRFVEKAEAGEEILIARAGKPVARLVGLLEPEQKPRTLGLGRGKYSFPENFDASHAKELVMLFELDQ